MSDKPDNFGKYLTILAILVLGGALTVGGINYFVDPYMIFGKNQLGNFSSADRESKSFYYDQSDYDAIIMGNSRAAMIPADQLQGHNFFSATFGGALPEELYFFTHRFVKDVDVVVILLDQTSFTDKSPLVDDPFTPPSVTEKLAKLFGMQALDESIKTIRRSAKGEAPTFADDGSFIMHRWITARSIPNEALLQREFDTHRENYENFELMPERMTYLRRLVEDLRGRGAWVVAVIAPVHEHSLELMEGTPAAEQLAEWKQQVRDIFPNTIDLMDSEYSASENFLATDPTHYKPEVGVRMINESVLPLRTAPRKID